MHKTMIGLALVYLFLVTCVWSVPIKVIDELDFHAANAEERPAVIANRLPPIDFWLAFNTNEGRLRYKQNIQKSWTAW